MAYRRHKENLERAQPERYEANIKDVEESDRKYIKEQELKSSRRQMERSYANMMATYAEQQKRLSSKPGWRKNKTKGAEEPDELTVTQVNQTHKLLKSRDRKSATAEQQSSIEWLEHHSLEEMKLTLKDLVDQGQIGKPGMNKETGKIQQHIQFDSIVLNEFEYKLNLAIEAFTNRIKWLMMGSRRVFGLLKGSKIGIVIDSSDANCGFGRLSAFQEAMTHLLDEQIMQMKGLYVMAYGTETVALWKNTMDISGRRSHKHIQEAKGWIDTLTPSGGTNLLKALKNIYKIKDIDSILLVLGSTPDQNPDVLCHYVEEMTVGTDVPIQAVAYDVTNQSSQVLMKDLAEITGGRFHCYSSTSEEQFYTGSDVSVLLGEIQKTQDIINKVKEMRQGMMGTALVSVMNEISREVSQVPQSTFLPKPQGHMLPLNIEMPKFDAASSRQWLSKHGLKAKNLDLYQVLAPNAYSYKEEFIPVIGKTVQSQVHERAMAQFQWHDGTMRNIHVDMTQLFEYQKQLGAIVKIYEKRVDWLSGASRKIFGTVVEKNVVILIDLSICNLNYLIHIQHSMRLLLEQQLANKDFFNIITFGDEIKSWKSTMVPPTPENLQAAWKFVLGLQCQGSRNVLTALHRVLENEQEADHGIEVEGLYLFTSGIPDQPSEVLTQYLEERCAGTSLRLHVILFNVDDYDANGAIPSRYANITKTAECLRNLSHNTNGRFHWFRETGIIESDDIAAIGLEIERALNFSKKCMLLVESVKIKFDEEKDYRVTRDQLRALPPGTTHKSLPQPNQLKALPAPRECHVDGSKLSSEGDIQQSEVSDEGSGKIISSSASHSKTSKVHNSSLTSRGRNLHSGKDGMKQVNKTPNVKKSHFFINGDKNAVGSVYEKYQPAQRPRSGKAKPMTAACIPDKDEQLSSKEWLRMYSLGKLKLDLNKLLSTSASKTSSAPVKVLNKSVESKVFSMYPKVSIKGNLRHMHLRPQELQEYVDQVSRVLKRYIKRLQWLLSGSRRLFGTVVEKRVIFLIDTSGSMVPYMEELRKELASLVWDQLYKNKVMFNLIQFSGTCCSLASKILPATEENCHKAVKFISEMEAKGNTCTLDALQMAFLDANVEAIYLFTDGKPDSSTSLVLREIAADNATRNVTIHTISFNCEDSTANNFLKMLATENRGRYHRCHSDFDAQIFAHKLLTDGFDDSEHPHLPDFEGEDLKRLGNEISLARKFISQARMYRSMLIQQQQEEALQVAAKREEHGLVMGNAKPRPTSGRI